jgi:hypothetical protein
MGGNSTIPTSSSGANVMRMLSFGKSACLISAVVLFVGCFEQVASAEEQVKKPVVRIAANKMAVLNKSKDTSSDKEWVWRDKRLSASEEGIEGIIAWVKPFDENIAELKIWIYQLDQTSSPAKLKLSEVYGSLYLTENEEVNSNRGKRKTFHYKVSANINRADGMPTTGTRTFLITATRERGNNIDRTLRITTFTQTSSPAPLPTQGPKPTPAFFLTLNPANLDSRSFDCSDYPDDAVLEEDEHALTVTSGVLQPETNDWMSWP